MHSAVYAGDVQVLLTKPRYGHEPRKLVPEASNVKG